MSEKRGRYIEMTIDPIGDAQEGDQAWLDECEEVGNGGVDLVLVKVGDLAKHRVEGTGLVRQRRSSGPPCVGKHSSPSTGRQNSHRVRHRHGP